MSQDRRKCNEYLHRGEKMLKSYSEMSELAMSWAIKSDTIHINVRSMVKAKA